MTRSHLTAVVLTGLLLLVCNLQAQVQTFNLTNNTGMVLTAVTISPAGANTWSSNLCPKDKIADKENFDFKQPVDKSSCNYDIMFTSADGKIYSQNNVNLCSGTALSLMMPSDTKTNTKTDMKTDMKTDTKTDTKTDPKPDTKTDPTNQNK